VIVQEPTRESNILDIVVATSNTFLGDLSVTVPLSTSDHNMIILKTNLEAKATKITTSLPNWEFEHEDYASINAFLSNINWNDTFSSSITVQDCWNSFSQILGPM